MTKKRSAEIMVKRLPLTKARVNLGAVIKAVHLEHEYVILEKDGIPVAGIMNIDEFEDYLELQDPEVRAVIAKGHKEYVAGKHRPARALLEEMARPRRKQPARKRPAAKRRRAV